MSTTVIIPAYNPDEKLKILVKELKEHSFDVLVVDDGSCAACQPYFDSLDAFVLTNSRNMG